jgi:hypothetical protein
MTGQRAGHLAPRVLNEMTGSVAGHDGASVTGHDGACVTGHDGASVRSHPFHRWYHPALTR